MNKRLLTILLSVFVMMSSITVLTMSGCGDKETAESSKNEVSAAGTDNSETESKDTSVESSAEESDEDINENATYTYENGVLTVLSQEFFESSHPEFRHSDELKKIILNEGVTAIAKNSFSACKNLKSVSFPQSLEYIEDSAFHSCGKLDDFVIPENTELGSYVFYNTGWFKNQPDGELYLGINLVGYKGDMPENYTLNIKDGTKVISGKAFSSANVHPAAVNIPDSVKVIGEDSFSCCDKLSSVTIPDGVGKIEKNTFGCCTGLKSVKIGKSVKEIGEYAFGSCEALEDIELPDSVYKLEAFSFSCCPALKNFTIPASVEIIEHRVFEEWNADQTINVKGKSSKPESWDNSWDALCNAKIVWDK